VQQPPQRMAPRLRGAAGTTAGATSPAHRAAVRSSGEHHYGCQAGVGREHRRMGPLVRVCVLICFPMLILGSLYVILM
jgi:hypothetical protein